MKFRQTKKNSKIILVISDLHLGAGKIVKGRRNTLEDFHYDKEFVEFLHYFSTGEYLKSEVELVINGDFFDFLAVPYVEYFDDEYWSEKAALDKLDMIINGHLDVIEALGNFLSYPNKSIKYLIGNHDAELVFPSVQEKFLKNIPEKHVDKFKFILDDEGHSPLPEILITHGNEYESAHNFKKQIVVDKKENQYFIPPWGSYYVTRVINRFKNERHYINSVRPIRTFIIYGLIFDTLLILRFIMANISFVVMVLLVTYIRDIRNVKQVFLSMVNELSLFQDYETLTRDFFYKNNDVRVLIVGHTHEPNYRQFPDGNIFINTGTWTRMHRLDLGGSDKSPELTFALIREENNDFEVNLHSWKGMQVLPYGQFY